MVSTRSTSLAAVTSSLCLYVFSMVGAHSITALVQSEIFNHLLNYSSQSQIFVVKTVVLSYSFLLDV